MLIELNDMKPFVGDEVTEWMLSSLIQGAEALAVQAAPCLKDATDEGVLSVARHVLRVAVLRWISSDLGTVSNSQVSVDDASVTDRYSDQAAPLGGLLWPTEIKALQAACAGANVKRARMGWLC